jgi:hypothetical protein
MHAESMLKNEFSKFITTLLSPSVTKNDVAFAPRVDEA